MEAGIFEAATVGRNWVQVSHLQYADDTVFVGSGRDLNIEAMKRILRCFEMLSGVKVNFQKCNIFGVNIDNNRLEGMANTLGCATGSVPFNFLGIKVGRIRNNRNEWSELINKMRSKIRSWEDRKISFGGRITLLRAVFSSIPIY